MDWFIELIISIIIAACLFLLSVLGVVWYKDNKLFKKYSDD